MKTLITALILAACTTAAFASTPTKPLTTFTVSQLLEGVNGNADMQEMAKDIIIGVSLGDDDVCNGDFTLGETADEATVKLKMLVRKYPEVAEKPAGAVMKLVLETTFSCK